MWYHWGGDLVRMISIGRNPLLPLKPPFKNQGYNFYMILLHIYQVLATMVGSMPHIRQLTVTWTSPCLIILDIYAVVSCTKL